MKTSLFRHPLFLKLIPWIFFGIFFSWGWKVSNLFTSIPAYGDVLEVLWGFQWYHDSLLDKHTSPLFTPLVFHPFGWHTATLAHTPAFFILGQPFYYFGGSIFAYNLFAIGALVVAFTGMLRFTRLYVSQYLTIFAALAFTFWRTSWGSVSGGHLHLAWLSALLPWLAWSLDRAKNASSFQQRRWLVVAGLLWGMMINFSLYAIFIGAATFVIWEKQLFKLSRLKQALIVGSIALIISLPTIGLYIAGSRLDQTRVFGVGHNVWWSASINSFFIPSFAHPISLIRETAHTIYHGPFDESGVMNFGPITISLALIGLGIAFRFKRHVAGIVTLSLTGIILSMGILVRWNGEFIQNPIFHPINELIWNIGHTLKPSVFSPSIHDPFSNGIPLPNFLLTAIVPFWEGARIVARFAVLGMIGLVILAGIALETFPKVIRIILIALWLVEILPSPTQNLPMPSNLHPAYTWLSTQSIGSNEAIVDLTYPTLSIGGEILWATTFHQKPTVSGVGSFWPEHTFRLWSHILHQPQSLANSQGVYLLQQYGVRYIFVHITNEKASEFWLMVQNNDLLRQVGCFDPLPSPNPWPYPICVAQIYPADHKPFSSLMLDSGWSQYENWGIWAESLQSTANWFSIDSKEQILRIEAKPFCVADRHQNITIHINGSYVESYRWDECEIRQINILIPASLIEQGWNSLTFTYDYAVSPAEITKGQSRDTRSLSTAFTMLEIER